MSPNGTHNQRDVTTVHLKAVDANNHEIHGRNSSVKYISLNPPIKCELKFAIKTPKHLSMFIGSRVNCNCGI